MFEITDNSFYKAHGNAFDEDVEEFDPNGTWIERDDTWMDRHTPGNGNKFDNLEIPLIETVSPACFSFTSISEYSPGLSTGLNSPVPLDRLNFDLSNSYLQDSMNIELDSRSVVIPVDLVNIASIADCSQIELDTSDELDTTQSDNAGSIGVSSTVNMVHVEGNHDVTLIEHVTCSVIDDTVIIDTIALSPASQKYRTPADVEALVSVQDDYDVAEDLFDQSLHALINDDYFTMFAIIQIQSVARGYLVRSRVSRAQASILRIRQQLEVDSKECSDLRIKLANDSAIEERVSKEHILQLRLESVQVRQNLSANRIDSIKNSIELSDFAVEEENGDNGEEEEEEEMIEDEFISSADLDQLYLPLGATLIQACYRGYRLRKRLKFKSIDRLALLVEARNETASYRNEQTQVQDVIIAEQMARSLRVECLRDELLHAQKQFDTMLHRQDKECLIKDNNVDMAPVITLNDLNIDKNRNIANLFDSNSPETLSIRMPSEEYILFIQDMDLSSGYIAIMIQSVWRGYHTRAHSVGHIAEIISRLELLRDSHREMLAVRQEQYKRVELEHQQKLSARLTKKPTLHIIKPMNKPVVVIESAPVVVIEPTVEEMYGQYMKQVIAIQSLYRGYRARYQCAYVKGENVQLALDAQMTVAGFRFQLAMDSVVSVSRKAEALYVTELNRLQEEHERLQMVEEDDESLEVETYYQRIHQEQQVIHSMSDEEDRARVVAAQLRSTFIEEQRMQAVIRLQSWFRWYTSRRAHLDRLWNIIIVNQLRKEAEADLERMKLEEAMILQANADAEAADNHAVILFQCCVRRYLAKQMVNSLRCHKPVKLTVIIVQMIVKLQARYRGKIVRKEITHANDLFNQYLLAEMAYVTHQQQQWATVAVQAMFRGFILRKRLREMLARVKLQQQQQLKQMIGMSISSPRMISGIYSTVGSRPLSENVSAPVAISAPVFESLPPLAVPAVCSLAPATPSSISSASYTASTFIDVIPLLPALDPTVRAPLMMEPMIPCFESAAVLETMSISDQDVALIAPESEIEFIQTLSANHESNEMLLASEPRTEVSDASVAAVVSVVTAEIPETKRELSVAAVVSVVTTEMPETESELSVAADVSVVTTEMPETEGELSVAADASVAIEVPSAVIEPVLEPHVGADISVGAELSVIDSIEAQALTIEIPVPIIALVASISPVSSMSPDSINNVESSPLAVRVESVASTINRLNNNGVTNNDSPVAVKRTGVNRGSVRDLINKWENK